MLHQDLAKTQYYRTPKYFSNLLLPVDGQLIVQTCLTKLLKILNETARMN